MLRRRSPPDPVTSDAVASEALTFLEPLFATAMRLTRNRSDAEDLVQDTFVKALRFAGGYTPGTNLKAWLFTILHNTWRNRVRDGGRVPVDVDSEKVEVAIARDGAVGADTPERLLMRDTLDALPEAYRAAVWLRDVEEFAYAEIASMLDVPIGTVMSRISRGRQALFRELTSTNSEVASKSKVTRKEVLVTTHE